MKQLWLLLIALLVASTAVASLGPVCSMSGSLQHIYGTAAANQRVAYQYGQAQNPGGAIIPGGDACSVKTDANGNLPTTGTCTSFTQGAYMFVTVGSGQPVKIQIPLMTSVDLATLILANMDPPSLVSSILALGTCAPIVTNPTLGSIGTATLTFGACQAVFPSATPGQFFVQGTGGSVVAASISGDVSASIVTPGLETVVGLQGIPVAVGTPANGNVLGYNSATGKWQPTNATNGGSGAINTSAYGTVGPNYANSLETTAFTSTSGSNQISVPSIVGTLFNTTYPYVALYGAGATPTAMSTPVFTVNPIHWTATETTVDTVKSTLASGCDAEAPLAWGDSGQKNLFVAYDAFEQGDTLTIQGNSYTATTVNAGNRQIVLNTNLLTEVSGRDVFDGVTNTDTSLVSATAAFTSADVGRPVYIYNYGSPLLPIEISAANTFIISITNGTTVVLNHATTATQTGAYVFMGPEPVSGVNCTTHRSYQTAFIYDDPAHKTYGTIGPLSSCQTSTTSSNALGFYNTNQLQFAWDTNAASLGVWYKKGDSCTGATYQGTELPSLMTNPQGHTAGNAYLNDTWLMYTNNVKAAPVTGTYHDVGQPYGQDFRLGTALPTGVRLGAFVTKITGVNGTTVTLADNVPNTATDLMGHDDGQPILLAMTAARQTTGVEQISYTGVYAPSGQYPVVTPLTPSYGSSFHFYGDGGGGFSGSVNAGTRMVWRGSLGGIMLGFIQMPRPEFDHMMLDDTGGTSPGVFIRLDRPNSLTENSTQGHLHDFALGVANTGIQVCNVGTDNCEFYGIDHFVIGGTNGAGGEYGINILGPQALDTGIDLGTAIYGQICINEMTGQVPRNINCPQIDGVGIWATNYFGTAGHTLSDSRFEHQSRLFYAPAYQGGASSQYLTLSNVTAEDIRFTPDCGYIVLSIGGKSFLTMNTFTGVAASIGQFSKANSSCPSGIMYSSDTGGVFTFFENTWDLTDTPFTNIALAASQLFYRDSYRNWQGVETPQPQPVVSTAPTALTMWDSCPYTFKAPSNGIIGNVQQATNCSLATGASITFGAPTTGNDFGGTFTLSGNGEQLECSWGVELHVGGGAGSAAADFNWGRGKLNSANRPGCSATANNPGTLNLYADPGGGGLILQNNTKAGWANPAPLYISSSSGGAR